MKPVEQNEIEGQIVEAFGGNATKTLRSDALAKRLDLPHDVVREVMTKLIADHRLVGALVTKPGQPVAVDARLALAEGMGAAPAPEINPWRPPVKPPGSVVVMAAPATAVTRRDQVLAEVRSATPARANTNDIAAKLKISAPAVLYELAQLRAEGLVANIGHRGWIAVVNAGDHPTRDEPAPCKPLPPVVEEAKRTLIDGHEIKVPTHLARHDSAPASPVIGLFSDDSMIVRRESGDVMFTPAETRVLFRFLNRLVGFAEEAA